MDNYSLEAFPVLPGDLMDHNNKKDLGLRVITSVTGSSIMCVVHRENEDSFLVLLPSRLISNGDKYIVESYMSVPFLRIMKSTVISIVPAFAEFEFYYLEYLLREAEALCPRVPMAKDIMQARFEVLTDLYKKKEVALIQNHEYIESDEIITLDKESAALLMIPITDQKYKH